MVAKKLHPHLLATIHTPKPQIRSVEPRKRRLGMRTIPCIFFGEERRIKKLCCVFFWIFIVFGRGEKVWKNTKKRAKVQKKVLHPGLRGAQLFITLARTSRRRPL